MLPLLRTAKRMSCLLTPTSSAAVSVRNFKPAIHSLPAASHHQCLLLPLLNYYLLNLVNERGRWVLDPRLNFGVQSEEWRRKWIAFSKTQTLFRI